MEGARIAALTAVLLGTMAMVINFMALPVLFNKIAEIQEKLQAQMNAFRVNFFGDCFVEFQLKNYFQQDADQTWADMMLLKNNYAIRPKRDSIFPEHDLPFEDENPFNSEFDTQLDDAKGEILNIN